jgi:hypothetical protein
MNTSFNRKVSAGVFALALIAGSAPLGIAADTTEPGLLKPETATMATQSMPSSMLSGGVERRTKLPELTAKDTKLSSMLAAPAATTKMLNDGVSKDHGVITSLQSEGGARTDRAPALNGKAVWFRIPAWMAGTWKIQDKTLLASVNLKNGQESPPRKLNFGYCGEPYGVQQDQNGTYWQFENVGKLPTNLKTDNQGLVHYNMVDSYQPIDSSESRLVLQKSWRNVTMDPTSNTIVKQRSFQSILAFTKCGDDLMNVDETMTAFDDTGAPVLRTQTQTVKCRVEPYREVASLHGQDVRGSFSQYMATRAKH